MRWLLIALTVPAFLAGCDKPAAKPQAHPAAEVTVQTIVPRDTPVRFEFVGQTQSTHQVQIRARVDGFLEQRVYTEGSLVKAGDVMFRQDPKPFQAQLDAAKGALAQQQAALQTANDNLARVKPLTALKALSQKDLDDATGQQQAAAAAVYTAKANVQTAQLNLSYTTITTPVTGVSSYAQVQDGAYVSSTNSLLTYVSQIDSLWVNFSVSEDDMLDFRTEKTLGVLSVPKDHDFVVDLVLSDGSTFPQQGRITFANADYDVTTGTYLLRATVPNPDLSLRPGQFVRVGLTGAERPNAILVPQAAVLQGAKGHFVMVLTKDNTAQPRPVEVGPWHGSDWFITGGLAAGDVVIIDGVSRLAPGAKVKVVATAPAPAIHAAPAAPGSAPASAQPPAARRQPGVIHGPAAVAPAAPAGAAK
ncbi:efflux RND transporter periplasmic adaptor subunit [uncultured Thiodictyon sp.]|uniref:efflux RND transporter periplasmic adaptor subunit n=1 Tax=uncultured Thiodictyon sp. TaxID=1846217 RepID=UPI0025DA8D03|nr:efflux RND transporter periplasmic adaptor subunit [uncultured Thiodictyon sp.]